MLLPGNELEHQIADSVVGIELQQIGHVGAAYLRQHSRLFEEPLLLTGCGRTPCADHLECDNRTVCQILAAVDRPHAPLSQFFQQLETAELCRHVGSWLVSHRRLMLGCFDVDRDGRIRSDSTRNQRV